MSFRESRIDWVNSKNDADSSRALRMKAVRAPGLAATHVGRWPLVDAVFLLRSALQGAVQVGRAVVPHNAYKGTWRILRELSCALWAQRGKLVE
jgi:hypothetical protein